MLVYYEDLFNTPYKHLGRDKTTGLDCYGFVIELTRRAGKPLKDLYIQKLSELDAPEAIAKLNVKEIEPFEVQTGDLVQCVYNNNLHIGFLIDPRTVIHMTYEGVKITPTYILKNKKYFRVED